MIILISETEKHPIPPGPLGEKPPTNDPRVIFFFGLHRKRGDNIIYSTKVHDNLFSAIEKYGLKLLTKEGETETGQMDHRNKMNEIREKSGGEVNPDMVGIAYNIRKEMPADKYREMVEEIAKSIE